VRPFLKKHPMDYWWRWVRKRFPNSMVSMNCVTIVFDRSGKLVKRFEGFTAEDALRAAVQQAL